MSAPVCRNCGSALRTELVDLGATPLANAFLRPEQLRSVEPHLPLCAWVCSRCFLVQLEAFERPEEIFSDYAYYSSWSSSWLAHAAAFVDASVQRLGLGPDSFVVEVASNDGYLLRRVVERGIRALGIEPAANVAEAAVAAGVDTRVAFFGHALGAEIAATGKADLIVANNVLAHVPDLHDFVGGFSELLGPEGNLSIEFPHLLELIVDCQYDTIYHEHFSYFSLRTAMDVLAGHGLDVIDVETLPTHGGSLRLWVCHTAAGRVASPAIAEVLRREHAAGLDSLDTYATFRGRVAARKRELLTTLIGLRENGMRVAAYGAAAKGNTLLNHCGIDPDLVEFVVDLSTEKQGRFLPGTRLPVLAPSALDERRPDVLLILPWNLQDEIVESTARIRDWGGRWLLQRPTLHLVA